MELSSETREKIDVAFAALGAEGFQPYLLGVQHDTEKAFHTGFTKGSPLHYILSATIKGIRDLEIYQPAHDREEKEAPEDQPLVVSPPDKSKETSITVNEENKDAMTELFTSGSSRVLGIRELWISGECEEFMKCLLNYTGNPELHLQERYVSWLDPELLSNVILRMETVYMTWCQMSTDQANAIFTALNINESKLKTFHLSHNNLSSVCPEVLATTVSKLETVDLSWTEVNSDQVESLLTAVRDEFARDGKVRLKSLNLSHNKLGMVDSDLMAEAVALLETVKLENSHLHPAHAEKIFNANLSNNGSGGLTSLTIGSRFEGWKGACNLSNINPDLIASGVCSLETADFSNTSLTQEQVESIFTVIKEDNMKTKSFNISFINLSNVDPDLMVCAVSKLKAIHMSGCELTKEQVNAVFTVIQNRSANIDNIDFSLNDLSDVSPELMAGAFSRLEVADISDIKMTKEQAKEVFAALNKESKMKSLNIADNDLWSVDRDLIVNTANKLEHLNLLNTEISNPVLNKLLEQSLVQTSLKNLELTWHDSMDYELIQRAQNKYSVGLSS